MRRAIALGTLGARYAISGGAAAIVDVGAFSLFHYWMSVGIAVAAVASFSLAAIFNYVLASYLVFKVPFSSRRFLAFFVAASLGLGVNTSVTLLSVYLLHTSPVLSKIFGIGVAFGFNFLVTALVVFPGAGKTRGALDEECC